MAHAGRRARGPRRCPATSASTSPCVVAASPRAACAPTGCGRRRCACRAVGHRRPRRPRRSRRPRPRLGLRRRSGRTRAGARAYCRAVPRYDSISALQHANAACRLCADAGLPIDPAPVFAGRAGQRAYLFGLAPGRVEEGVGLPWQGRAGRTLRRWLELDETCLLRHLLLRLGDALLPGAVALRTRRPPRDAARAGPLRRLGRGGAPSAPARPRRHRRRARREAPPRRRATHRRGREELPAR